ncbi:MAG: folate-binding protein YgfZ [Candidatus Promineofilum sp.]|nr:folate-binding protein YgfZ [Promineifilum sp.]
MTLNEPAPENALAEAYQAAHEAAVVVDHSARGLIELKGQSRLDLINRMSTQAIKELQEWQGAATVLTTDIGRIIDRVILYASDDRVLMLTGEGHADALVQYLRRNVFFNDDLRVTRLDGLLLLGVYGRRAGEMLAEVGFESEELPLHHWRVSSIPIIQAQMMPIDPGGGVPQANNITAFELFCMIFRADPIAGDGYYLLFQPEHAEQLFTLLSLGGFTAIDEDAYDYLRIEAGRPRFGRELTLDYIPLETGLWDDVSFSKGCYTGQEIIARMESRGKIAKRLARLRPASPVAAGAGITANGRPVGTITSAADGPAGPVALGYVKTAALDEGLGLTAEGVVLRVISGEE